MAKEAADDTICPMVPDVMPPIMASAVKYIRVSRMIDKDGRKRKSAIPMTDENRPNPFETTPQELLEAMQQRFKFGDFFVDLISKKGQVITGFPMFIEEEGGTDDPRDRRRGKDGDEEEEEEEEEEEGGDGKHAPGPGGGGPMFGESAGGAQAVPVGNVTVPGLAPERQAEWLASQSMMQAARDKEAAAELLAQKARERSEAFTERLIERALGGSAGAPAGGGLAAETIRNYEDRLRNYEDRARMFQSESDRLRQEIEDMRRRQRSEIDQLEASWRERLERAESGLREKLTKAEKHVYDLQTDNVKLTKAKHEAEVDADAADNAKHNGGDGLNLMGLAEKVAEIAPNLPAILEAVQKMGSKSATT